MAFQRPCVTISGGSFRKRPLPGIAAPFFVEVHSHVPQSVASHSHSQRDSRKPQGEDAGRSPAARRGRGDCPRRTRRIDRRIPHGDSRKDPSERLRIGRKNLATRTRTKTIAFNPRRQCHRHHSAPRTRNAPLRRPRVATTAAIARTAIIKMEPFFIVVTS